MEEGTSSASAECIDDAAHLDCLDTETRRLEPGFAANYLWMSGLGRGAWIEPGRHEVTMRRKSLVTKVLVLLNEHERQRLSLFVGLNQRALIDACFPARSAWSMKRMGAGSPAL